MNSILLIVCTLILFSQQTIAQNWLWRETQISNDNSISAIAKTKGGFFVAAADIAGVFISTNQGSSWKPTPAKPGNGSALDVVALNSGTILVGLSPGGLYKSSNAGSSWTPLEGIFKNKAIYGIDYCPKTNVLSVYSPAVGTQVSFDEGEHWAPLNAKEWLIVLEDNKGVLYSIGETIINKSTDSGKTWMPVGTIPTETKSIYSAQIMMDGTIYIVCSPQRLLQSSDEGKTWQQRSKGIESADVNILQMSDARRGFISSWGHGMFYTADSALTWQAAKEGIIDPLIGTFVLYDHIYLAGTNSGRIYTLDQTSPVHAESTQLSYSISTSAHGIQIYSPETSEVDIQCFDILGNVVVHERKYLHQGVHTMLQHCRLPSGTYGIVLQTSNGIRHYWVIL